MMTQEKAGLLAALRDAEKVLTAIECGHEKPLNTGMVLDAIRALLAKATNPKAIDPSGGYDTNPNREWNL